MTNGEINVTRPEYLFHGPHSIKKSPMAGAENTVMVVEGEPGQIYRLSPGRVLIVRYYSVSAGGVRSPIAGSVYGYDAAHPAGVRLRVDRQ
jgi:hypothetical protein